MPSFDLKLILIAVASISIILFSTQFLNAPQTCGKDFQIFTSEATGINSNLLKKEISSDLYKQISRYLGAKVVTLTQTIIKKSASKNTVNYLSKATIKTNNFIRNVRIIYDVSKKKDFYDIKGKACVSNLYLKNYIRAQAMLEAARILESYKYYLSAYKLLSDINDIVQNLGITAFLFQYQNLRSQVDKFLIDYRNSVNMSENLYSQGKWISAFEEIAPYVNYPEQSLQYNEILQKIRSKLSNVNIRIESPNVMEIYRVYTVKVYFENLPESNKLPVLVSDNFGNTKHLYIVGNSFSFSWKVSMLTDNYFIKVSIPGLNLSAFKTITLRVFNKGNLKDFSVDGFKTSYFVGDNPSFTINANSNKYYIYVFYYKGCGPNILLYDIFMNTGNYEFKASSKTECDKEGFVFLFSSCSLPFEIQHSYSLEDVRAKISDVKYQEIEKFFKIK